MTLRHADEKAAQHARAPRVALSDIEGKIVYRYDATAAQMINDPARHGALEVLSLCFLVMSNGFSIIGKSAPADARNFNASFGRDLAYEDAIRQLWPLEGYLLRDRLSAS